MKPTMKLAIAEVVVKCGKYAVPAMWHMLIFACKLTTWFIVPATTMAFAMWFTQNIDINYGHGALAAIAAYALAGYMGITGAHQISKNLNAYKSVKF